MQKRCDNSNHKPEFPANQKRVNEKNHNETQST